MPDLTPEQYEAALVYAEAGGEPLDAQLAVLDTVYNRLSSNKSYLKGEDVVSTILKKHQYATNKVRFKKALAGLAVDDPDYHRALEAVSLYHQGARPSILGATHFHSYEDELTPYWAKKITRLGKIGKLWLFKEE